MKTLVTLALALFCFSPQAYSKDDTSTAVAHFAQTYPQGAKPAAFLKMYRPQMPKDDSAYLAKQFKSVKLPSMPTVRVKDSTSLVFDYEGHSIVVSYLPNHVIKLNGKTLDLSEAGSVENQLKLVMNALPHYEKTSLLSVIVPRAYAEDSESRLSGVVVSGIGVALAVVGTPITIGLGVAIAVAGIVIWNDGVCQELNLQKLSCLDQKGVLDENIRLQPKTLRAIRSRQPRPVCPEKEVKNTDVEAAYDVLKQTVSAQRQLVKMFVTCRKTKSQVEECLHGLALDEYYLCKDMHGYTDSYLPNYARSGVRTQQVPPRAERKSRPTVR